MPVWVVKSLLVFLSMILLNFCLLTNANASTSVRFEHLSLEHGLSNTTVYDIFQDSDSFIWVATGDGLNRFDGYEFRVYRSQLDDDGSISNNSVMVVYEDSKGVLWVGTRGGLNRYDKTQDRFYRYMHDPQINSSLSNDDVRAIFEDSSGRLWIGTRNGLNLYDAANDRFQNFYHHVNDESSLSHSRISGFAEHPNGALWVATFGGGLNLFDVDKGKIASYRYDANDETSISDDRVYTLHVDGVGQLWVGTLNQGLNRFDYQSQKFKRFKHDAGAKVGNSLSHNRILSIVHDNMGRLWIGTYGGGVNRFDPKTETFEVYKNSLIDPNSLSSDRVFCLLVNRNGEVWAGTAAGGLNKFNLNAERFGHVYRQPAATEGLSIKSVSAFYRNKGGDLWIGGFGDGLERFNHQTQIYTHYKHDKNDRNSLSHNQIRQIIADRNGVIWVGTSGGGLNRFNAETNSFTAYRHNSQDSQSLSSDKVSALLIDSRDNFWVGTTGGGLNLFDSVNGTFRSFEVNTRSGAGLSHDEVITLTEDSEGYIWIGTAGGGLNRFDPRTLQFIQFRHRSDDSFSLSHDVVLSVVEDKAKRLWVGTMGGFNLLDRKLGRFVRYTESNGLVNDVIHGILPDEYGQLWLSTNKGLTRFDPEHKRFRHYSVKDGLQSDEFNRNAFYKADDGELFFGGVNGFNRFFASEIKEDSDAPPVVFTQFRLFNEPVGIKQADSRVFGLSQSINQLDRLVLNYDQDLMSFEFSALHYTNPKRNQFAYKLIGWDRNWIYTDANNRRATYTNIPDGQYTLHVKAANQAGYWNEDGKKIDIVILPPPWDTWWAYLIYFVSVCLIGYWFLHNQRQRLSDARRLNLQLKQVDKLKDEFLANTSHELRTPLNGIIGLAESLIDGVTGQLPARTNANLAMIVASGRRLANLVNDILDFSKLKNRNLVLYPKPCDLHSMVGVVLALSKPLLTKRDAKPKDIQLINNVPKDIVAALADEDRLLQVLHNLVDNAIKFTEIGQVTVSAKQVEGMLEISVSDTGLGIESDQFETIFKSFEQIHGTEERNFSGTGLGLSVSRQLVELHGGTLKVESEIDKGSTFSFTMPVAEEDANAEAYAAPAVSQLHYLHEGESDKADNDEYERQFWPKGFDFDENEADDYVHSEVMVDSTNERLGKQVIHTKHAHDCSKFKILLVDDEPVNRQVLHNHLSVRNYQLVEASGGEKAIDLVENNGPFDLILLDVMMPNMSGYEVCKILRQTYAVNDLPIIFLTAKNQVADLVQSFAVGANDFLTKPISKYELLKRVETHLRLLDINRHLEQKITERTTELVHAEKMASLGTLTAGVAHEINNPTNYVHVSVKTLGQNLADFKTMLLDLVTEEAQPELLAAFEQRFSQFKGDVDTIVEGTGRIRDIVADLQAFTQIDASQKTLVTVTDCLNSAINLVRTQNSDVANFFADYQDAPEIMCYPAQLNQLFMNLIVNACDAIRVKMSAVEQQVNGKVRIGCKVEADFVVISISDNGVGMTDETKSRLFEPFYTTKDVGEGTGLGLSISYGIVNKHGGELTVESTLNQGSTFKLLLPMRG